jgi:hypothetical protein
MLVFKGNLMAYQLLKTSWWIKTILASICLLALPAIGATVSVEVYRYNQLTQNISDTNVKINFYVDGNRVLSDKSCPYTAPCKIEISKKSILSICETETISRCQTGIPFDPAQSSNQRYGFLVNFNGYALIPFTVFSPTEIPILNDYLQRQLDAEKQRDELRNRTIN